MVKWPWVSRLAYETLDREHNRLAGQIAVLDSRVTAFSRRHDELVAKMVEMKRDGFVAAPKYETPAPEQRLPDVVVDALDKLGLSGSMRSQMEGWAWRQLGRNRDAKLVAADLKAGGLGTAEAE